MKKNTMSSALLAGLAGVAGIAGVSNAVVLNPDGLGQALIYPYYTVNANNVTAISVVNTTNTVKAVKVRFLESRNSREVLDFNLYLSPYDVWTGAVFAPQAGATTAAAFTTTDNSCTVPLIKGNTALPALSNGQRYVPFRNGTYAGLDNGPATLDRTREGHIELIEMATITNATRDSAAAATHDSTGIPDSCAQLNAAWAAGSAGYWAANASVDTDVATGGLFGGGSLINVSNGTYINYNADALDGLRTGIGSQNHSAPSSLFPRIVDAANLQLLPAAGVESIVFNNGSLIRSTWNATNTGPTGGPIDAVSAVLSYDNLMNEYATESAVNGKSEWVVTFPTKRYHVDSRAATGYTVPLRPFTVAFPISGTAPGRACEPIGVALFNREEQSTVGGVDFSPTDDAGGASLCYEAQIISFNQTGTPSQIFGSPIAYNVNTTSAPFGGSGLSTPTAYESGWLNIDLGSNNHIGRPSIQGHQYRGLPVTGFWANTVENNNAAPGVRAYYGGAFRHHGTRFCFTGTIAAPLACVSAP
jgi:hypothetical protein